MPKISSRQLRERKMLTKVLVAPYANAKRAVATCSLGPQGDGPRFHIARWPAFTRCKFPCKALGSYSNGMPDTKDLLFPVVW